MLFKDPDEWKAYHLFCHSPLLQERLLADVLFPLVRRLQEDGRCGAWFFIRYWEGGPHIRFRLKDYLHDREDAERLLREKVGRFFEENPISERLTKESYYIGHKFDGEPIDPATLPWYVHGQIVPMQYQPEYARYGGQEAMKWSERLFHASSMLAARLMEASADNIGKRLILAFDTMLVSVLGFGVEPGRLGAYFGRYAAYWKRFVNSDETTARARESAERQSNILLPRFREFVQFSKLRSGIPLYREWMEEVAMVRSALAALRTEGRLLSPVTGLPAITENDYRNAVMAIASSHLHMTNNRLGIVPAYEHVLGVMLHTVSGMVEADIGGEPAWRS
jgi:thiopeptide-type bacteriocin biosynthesis protein